MKTTAPHNLAAERSLLGALLLDPTRIGDAAETLTDGAFFDPRHETLWQTLKALAQSGATIDFVVVGEALRTSGKFQEIGGSQALIDLAQSVPSSAMLGHHTRVVTQTAKLRALIQAANEIVAEASTTRATGDDVRELLARSEQRVFALARDDKSTSVQTIDTVMLDVLRSLEPSSDAHRKGIPTGYYDLDDMLGGLHKGDLVIVAARPSMGKTAFALNVIENVALRAERPSVMMFSLEMGANSLGRRLLSARARVPGFLLRGGNLAVDTRNVLHEASEDIRQARLTIDDTPGLSIMSLRSRARRQAASPQGLDLVVVDYLQLLAGPKSESRQQEVSAIARGLKELARELEIPVVALAQLSREVDRRNPPRPQLADLRESGSIEQDADVVMFLYRADYYHEHRTEQNRGQAEVLIAKHRNGATGEVLLQFFPEHMRFENRQPQGVTPVSL